MKIPQVIPKQKINLALRTINHRLSRGMDPSKMEEYKAGSYVPELRKHESISDLLYRSPLFTIAESLIGADKVRAWGDGQIALRFPTMDAPGKFHPHIDGMYRRGNQARPDPVQSFTMLAGILLSDTPNRYWGNFTVWPGTHRLFEDYFQKHGVKGFFKGLPPVKMSEPEQITGGAGDVVISHYQTAHTAAANVSPYIRYAVFFRLMHVRHRAHGEKVFTNIWLEWPGLSSLVEI